MTSAPVWEDGAELHLPALEGDTHADVCVVGLGGSGLSCIDELLSLGQRVVGIDARTVGGGAAGRNGGFLLAGLYDFYHDAVALFGRARARAIYQRTIEQIDRITAETPGAVRRAGSLRIAADEQELEDCEAQLAALQADSFPVERYEGIEGRGLLIPTDGSFNPLLRCRLLARRALDHGAQLFAQSTAIDIAGDHVTTDRATVHCNRVIVAVDGRLDAIIPEIASRVRNARLQMLATDPVPSIDLPRPVYRRYGFDYWQQLPDKRIALGGQRDAAMDDEWTDSEAITQSMQLRLERVLREQLHVDAPITHRWSGIVGYSADGMPIVDEPRPGVWAIGGYSGTGNVLGAICGRGVAQLVVTGHSELVAEIRGLG